MIVCDDPENCQPYGEHYAHYQSGRTASPHPEPHSMNGALWPERPPSCDCECSRCWIGYAGACLCADCQDLHHDHSMRGQTAPTRAQS